MRYVIFTDLDGTLLDHHTYEAEAAKKSLADLKARNIPVVFCSSKTSAEQAYLQQQLQLDHPFIIENGSAIIFPYAYFPTRTKNAGRISSSYCMIPLAEKKLSDIHQVLDKISKITGKQLYGFTNASLREISEATGLTGDFVQRAKNRSFTETLFTAKLSQYAVGLLESNGLCLSQGGRFLTIQDETINKGKAVRHTIELFAYKWGVWPVTLGIGDSPNDAPMLRQVDKPFLVQRPDKTWADLQADGLTKLTGIGPEGFSEMVNLLLSGALP